MTRDDAIKMTSPFIPKSDAEPFVDVLVALGVLKLDELKTPWDKFTAAMVSDEWDVPGADVGLLGNIDKCLKFAGLRIVEAE